MFNAASRRSPACPPYAESSRESARSAADASRPLMRLDARTDTGVSAGFSMTAA
jgi:hypothetical protein